MRIPRALVEEMVAHALEDAPNECCGIVGGRNGEARSVHRARNTQASPLRYEVDPSDQIRIWNEVERRGDEVVAFYHSHISSPAYPSQTDVNLHEPWPGTLCMIVSLADPDTPDVRAFTIQDGEIEEEEITVE